MGWRWPVLLLAGAVLAAAPADEGPGRQGRAFAGLIEAGASVAAMMPADDAGTMTWATWVPPMDGLGGQVVHLALFRADGHAATQTWSQDFPGGYLPVLESMAGWRYQGNPVAQLRLQYGAAFSHTGFYGVGEGGTPVLVGEIEGAVIEPTQAGPASFQVLDTADLKGPPHCYGWDADKMMVTPLPCG